MHTLGKVMIWLVVLAAGAGTVLTAKLIQVRNSHTRKAEKFDADFARVSPQLQKAEAELQALRSEMARELLSWDRAPISADTTVINAQQGRLTVELGQANNLKDKQWLYGFELSPEGKPVYRGAFEITQLGDSRSAITPTFRLRPEDIASLRSGNWRWRTLIPAAYPARHSDLQVQLLRNDELLVDRTANVTEQQKLLKEATAQLARRREELVGGPTLPKEDYRPTEEKAGLVAALQEVEEMRNQLLIDVDQLRRNLREVSDKIGTTQEENLVLAGKLPKSSSETASRRD
ncbi:MAG: hypothetical protein C0478_12970 [Planctomyces sp.]|nr:hypothetical protein [Planctomyces sp.]